VQRRRELSYTDNRRPRTKMQHCTGLRIGQPIDQSIDRSTDQFYFAVTRVVIRLEAIDFNRIRDSLSSAHRMHDFTDFRQPDFTKFEHSTSIGVAMNLF